MTVASHVPILCITYHLPLNLAAAVRVRAMDRVNTPLRNFSNPPLRWPEAKPHHRWAWLNMRNSSPDAQYPNRPETTHETGGDPTQWKRPWWPRTAAALRPSMITAATVMSGHGWVGKTAGEPALLTYGVVQEMCSPIHAIELSHWAKDDQSRIRATAGIPSRIQRSQ